MSATVDNRIVEMGFNNKEFESGVKQSTESLEKLKKSLDLSDSAKGLNNLSDASRKFSLGHMGEGIQNISSKFSAMGAIGFTVLQNLTNAAISYGKKFVNGLLTPMRTGFQEYETQMNAIQTVLANTESKGTTLEDVSAALNELNTYADQTIYNFTEMTRNIGTFTAAGVSLETSTAAIKGIANLAAVSGSNSQQASTAMYQLSQALSSGTVKLMDWNSVVNAGMGGQVFQDALKETARVSGIAIDDLIDKHGSFRETLSTGWLSSEVLLDTLKKFTGDLSAEQLVTMGYTEDQIEAILRLGQTANDAATKVKTFTQLKDTLAEALQSGWTKSWEIIIGDFEEAKAFFTEISDTLGAMIGASADARNKILQDWKDAGGRALLIESLRNSFDALLRIIEPIKEAFRDVFGPGISGEGLAVLTAHLRKFTASLKISSETAEKLRSIFRGVFSIFAIVKDVVVALATGFLSLFKTVNVDGGGIIDRLAAIGEKITEWTKGVDIAKEFANAFVYIQNVLYNIGTWIVYFANLAKEKFAEVSEAVKEFIGSFSIDTSGIKSFFSSIKERLSDLGSMVNLSKKADEGITKVGESAIKISPQVKQVLSSLAKTLKPIWDQIVEGISNLNFVEIFNTLFKGISAGLIGALLLAMKRFVDSGTSILEEAGGIFEGVTGILDGVRGSLEAYQAQLKSKVLLNIAIAIGILAAALVAISLIDSDKLLGAMAAISGLFANLAVSMAAFNKVGGAGAKQALALNAMALSILILAGALNIIADIPAENLWNGLKAIYAMMAGVLIFSKLMSKSMGDVYKGSSALATFAVSLTILVSAVAQLGQMNVETLTNGLIALGILLAEIAIFMRLAGNAKVSASAGLGIIGVAAAILVLSNVVKTFGDMDVAKLQQGVVALGVVLAEVGIFTRLVGNGKGLISASIAMLAITGAMMILVDVIGKMADMTWEELGRGLAGLAGSLLILAVAMRAMPKGSILNAAALVIVAAAITILTESLTKIAELPMNELKQGLLGMGIALGILVIGLNLMTGTLAGSFALLVAAGALMAITFVISALGALPIGAILIALVSIAAVFAIIAAAGYLLMPVIPALLALGASMVLLGAAVALVGLGLLLFATGLTALAASGAAAALAITAFVTAMINLIPTIIQALVNAIVIFAEGVIKATPVVAKAITTLMLGFLQVIIDTAPKIFEALTVLLKGLIQLIVDVIPDFVNAVITLLLTLLQTIAQRLPEFIQAGFDILIGFLQGIRDNIAEVVTVVTEIVTEFLGAIGDNLPDIIQAGWDLILDFINGMADSVDRNMATLLEAVGRLASNIIDGLVRGLVSGAGQVIQTLINLALDAFEAAKRALGISSPSKLFHWIGEKVPEGLANGVVKTTGLVVDAIGGLIDKGVDTASGMSKAISGALNSEIEMDPTIRPVLDMSDIVAGGELVDSLFGDKSLNLIPALQTSSAISSAFNKNGVIVDQNGVPVSQATTISFEQNNYSPKALSRIDIYRQTNNQLKALKGVVGT